MEIVRDERKEFAILVGIDYKKESLFSFEDSISEVKELAKACNIEIVSLLTQKKEKPETGTYLGTGKLRELKEIIDNYEVDYVIFDNELSGIQIRNLEEYLETTVLDRTGLILTIFASRAKSREGKLQVELARLQYEKPRLIGLGNILSRTGAGRLARGQGESQLELDRRQISNKIHEIKKELEEVKKHRDLQRKQRRRNNIPTVSLVGYTNAGKSTLMNYFMDLSTRDIAENKAFVQDMLFATLDSFSKKITFEDNKSFILSDTVGFVSKLPHSLVEAFKSTLEEVIESDFLVYVVDISSKNYEHQLKVTQNVIKELEADSIPFIVVYNKIDKISDEILKERGNIATNFIDISALNGIGIDKLIETIKKNIFKDEVEVELLIPYSDGSVTSHLQNSRSISKIDYRDEGTYLKVVLKNSELSKYEKYFFH
ncbi:MAG: GTPase HflX [Fusobacteriaceae bacterium]|nr:GTPase HflX [Fusobacteriaceae bacterium]MBN2838236.1 GTPase HflX [Fusobacteriaceae bacterium]